MIRFVLQRLIAKNRELLLREALLMNGFMVLFMKPVNTGTGWTKEEKQTLKKHIRHLASYVPVLIIFLLPGGSLLLPFLAEVLDRRKKKRLTESEAEAPK
ncbi:MAG: hypothetical protein HZB31_07150 [Nitrospirae bacterium]|nr:hypothetical protein [Nitrospirota bacterium]